MPRYYRKVIKITAEDSPNVRLALAQQRAGKPITGEVLVPGVLTWHEYQKRRATWDTVRQCIGLDGEFYEGAEVLLYPRDWLDRAEKIAVELRLRSLKGYTNGSFNRKAEGIGIDPAAGGDKTAMVAVDRYGVIEMVSKKTPDTSVITGEAIAFMRKHNARPDQVCFDQGGGGQQHADRLISMGYKGIRSIPFGGKTSLELKRGKTQFQERVEVKIERYVYVNLRAEMYYQLRLLLDPAGESEHGFAIPPWYPELRQQLAPIPLLYDGEGRIRLLPKDKKDPTSKEKTLTELIGHSPDEADALVLAIHAMTSKPIKAMAGAIV